MLLNIYESHRMVSWWGFVAVLIGLAGFGGYKVYEEEQENHQKIQEVFSQNLQTHQRILEESQEPMTVTVLGFDYNNKLSSVPEYHRKDRKTGLVSQAQSEAFSNETVKVDSTLAISAQTEDGRPLGLAVIDSVTGGQTKEGLKALLDGMKPGTRRLQFPQGNIMTRREAWPMRRDIVDLSYHHKKAISEDTIRSSYGDPKETYFTPDTQFGTKRADDIRVLDAE